MQYVAFGNVKGHVLHRGKQQKGLVKGRNARAKGCFTQFRMLNLTFQKYGFNINTRQ